MSRDVAIVLALTGFGIAGLAVLAWALATTSGGYPVECAPRRAADPPAGGARRGVHAVAPLADMPTLEPPVTPSALVRPYVTHHLTVAVPPTAPLPLRAVNGRAVVRLHRCTICRDGASVALGTCPWCGCPAGGWPA